MMLLSEAPETKCLSIATCAVTSLRLPDWLIRLLGALLVTCIVLNTIGTYYMVDIVYGFTIAHTECASL